MTRQVFIVPEHEFEPEHGLPEKLPSGEVVRWQGAPSWQTLAIEAFHVRKLVIYFAIILLLRAVFALSDGAPVTDTALSILILTPLAILAIGLTALIAWLTARTTAYTITDQRVVMRVGIVLSVTYNLPFKSLESVGIKRFTNGAGDIALTIGSNDRIAYLHLWPHARPWHFVKAQPMMRSVPNVAAVANILTEAMASASGGIATNVPTTDGVVGNLAANNHNGLVANV